MKDLEELTVEPYSVGGGEPPAPPGTLWAFVWVVVVGAFIGGLLRFVWLFG